MKRFTKFLKDNVIWACIGCVIYWGIPYIVVIILGLLVNPWHFTIFAAVFTAQVALPAIPIIIGISLGIKTLCTLHIKKH